MRAEQESRSAQFLVAATIVLTIGLAAAVPVHAIEDCCNIVSIDRKTGLIVVREIATGLTKALTITNNQLLEQLRPGATFGPDSVDGLEWPPSDVEPNWAEDCCNFRALPRMLPQGQTNVGTSEQPIASAGTIRRVAASYAQGIPAEVPAAQMSDGVTLHNILLKRRGSRALKLTFDVTNETDSQVGLRTYSMVNNGKLSEITLLDFDSGKRYEVVMDDTGNCVCSRGSHPALYVDSGATKSFWAHFAAPPSYVTMLTLDIPGGVPVDDIPIQ